MRVFSGTGNAKYYSSILRGNTSERNFVTILISMELDILAENIASRIY
jgi:hypothetical protein